MASVESVKDTAMDAMDVLDVMQEAGFFKLTPNIFVGMSSDLSHITFTHARETIQICCAKYAGASVMKADSMKDTEWMIGFRGVPGVSPLYFSCPTLEDAEAVVATFGAALTQVATAGKQP